MDVLIKTVLLCFNMLYSPLVEYTPKLQDITIVKGLKSQIAWGSITGEVGQIDVIASNSE